MTFTIIINTFVNNVKQSILIIVPTLITEVGFLCVKHTFVWNILTSYSYFVVHESTEAQTIDIHGDWKQSTLRILSVFC